MTAASATTTALEQGSTITVPAGSLLEDRIYTVSVVPNVAFILGNTNNVPEGGAVTVETSAAYATAASAISSTHGRSPRFSGPPVLVTLRLPSSISPGDEPLVRLVGFDESTLDYDASGSIDITGNTASVEIPATLFRKSKRITLYDAKYVGPPDPPYGGRMFAANVWSGNVSLKPRARTLLVLHGICSSVEKAFETNIVSALKTKGSYDQVIGYDYDWTQPPDVLGQQIGQFVTSLGLQTPIDVIAHSYGGVVAMSMIGSSKVNVDNLVTLGSPLAGSPFLNYSIVTAIAATSPDFIGALSKFKQAAKSGMIDAIAANSPLLVSIKATMESVAPPTRVIKVAGLLEPAFEKGSIFAALVDATSPLLARSDGLVIQDSATDPAVYGAEKTDPLTVSASPTTETLAFTDFHTSLEGDVAAQASYIPLMRSGYSPDGLNERTNNYLKGAGSYVYIWWSYVAGTPDTIFPVSVPSVTVDPASIGVAVNPPPNGLPAQHVKYIATGKGTGFVSMPVNASNSSRQDVGVTVYPDCAGC